MYLGLDLGTSCLKAVLINTQGQVIGRATANISTNNPKLLWSEQGIMADAIAPRWIRHR